MRFDPTLPHPLPEVDRQLFDELLGESERFVDNCGYRVMSDELPTRFLDFWLLPEARTAAQCRHFDKLYKSETRGVLLQLPLHLFDYVYRRRFDPPTTDMPDDEAAEDAEMTAEALRRYESDPEFQAHMNTFIKRLHQFNVLLQYIRIMYETGMVQHMRRFDLFDVDAYEDVFTDIGREIAEALIEVLNRAEESEFRKQ